eukprot:scpid53872/ scgid12766/ 
MDERESISDDDGANDSSGAGASPTERRGNEVDETLNLGQETANHPPTQDTVLTAPMADLLQEAASHLGASASSQSSVLPAGAGSQDWLEGLTAPDLDLDSSGGSDTADEEGSQSSVLLSLPHHTRAAGSNSSTAGGQASPEDQDPHIQQQQRQQQLGVDVEHERQEMPIHTARDAGQDDAALLQQTMEGTSLLARQPSREQLSSADDSEAASTGSDYPGMDNDSNSSSFGVAAETFADHYAEMLQMDEEERQRNSEGRHYASYSSDNRLRLHTEFLDDCDLEQVIRDLELLPPDPGAAHRTQPVTSAVSAWYNVNTSRANMAAAAAHRSRSASDDSGGSDPMGAGYDDHAVHYEQFAADQQQQSQSMSPQQSDQVATREKSAFHDPGLSKDVEETTNKLWGDHLVRKVREEFPLPERRSQQPATTSQGTSTQGISAGVSAWADYIHQQELEQTGGSPNVLTSSRSDAAASSNTATQSQDEDRDVDESSDTAKGASSTQPTAATVDPGFEYRLLLGEPATRHDLTFESSLSIPEHLREGNRYLSVRGAHQHLRSSEMKEVMQFGPPAGRNRQHSYQYQGRHEGLSLPSPGYRPWQNCESLIKQVVEAWRKKRSVEESLRLFPNIQPMVNLHYTFSSPKQTVSRIAFMDEPRDRLASAIFHATVLLSNTGDAVRDTDQATATAASSMLRAGKGKDRQTRSVPLHYYSNFAHTFGVEMSSVGYIALLVWFCKMAASTTTATSSSTDMDGRAGCSDPYNLQQAPFRVVALQQEVNFPQRQQLSMLFMPKDGVNQAKIEQYLSSFTLVDLVTHVGCDDLADTHLYDVDLSDVIKLERGNHETIGQFNNESFFPGYCKEAATAVAAFMAPCGEQQRLIYDVYTEKGCVTEPNMTVTNLSTAWLQDATSAVSVFRAIQSISASLVGVRLIFSHHLTRSSSTLPDAASEGGGQRVNAAIAMYGPDARRRWLNAVQSCTTGHLSSPATLAMHHHHQQQQGGDGRLAASTSTVASDDGINGTGDISSDDDDDAGTDACSDNTAPAAPVNFELEPFLLPAPETNDEAWAYASQLFGPRLALKDPRELKLSIARASSLLALPPRHVYLLAISDACTSTVAFAIRTCHHYGIQPLRINRTHLSKHWQHQLCMPEEAAAAVAPAGADTAATGAAKSSRPCLLVMAMSRSGLHPVRQVCEAINRRQPSLTAPEYAVGHQMTSALSPLVRGGPWSMTRPWSSARQFNVSSRDEEQLVTLVVLNKAMHVLHELLSILCSNADDSADSAAVHSDGDGGAPLDGACSHSLLGSIEHTPMELLGIRLVIDAEPVTTEFLHPVYDKEVDGNTEGFTCVLCLRGVNAQERLTQLVSEIRKLMPGILCAQSPRLAMHLACMWFSNGDALYADPSQRVNRHLQPPAAKFTALHRELVPPNDVLFPWLGERRLVAGVVTATPLLSARANNNGVAAAAGTGQFVRLMRHLAFHGFLLVGARMVQMNQAEARLVLNDVTDTGPSKQPQCPSAGRTQSADSTGSSDSNSSSADSGNHGNSSSTVIGNHGGYAGIVGQVQGADLTAGASLVLCVIRENCVERLQSVVTPSDAANDVIVFDSVPGGVLVPQSFAHATAQVKHFFPGGLLLERQTLDMRIQKIFASAVDEELSVERCRDVACGERLIACDTDHEQQQQIMSRSQHNAAHDGDDDDDELQTDRGEWQRIPLVIPPPLVWTDEKANLLLGEPLATPYTSLLGGLLSCGLRLVALKMLRLTRTQVIDLRLSCKLFANRSQEELTCGPSMVVVLEGPGAFSGFAAKLARVQKDRTPTAVAAAGVGATSNCPIGYPRAAAEARRILAYMFTDIPQQSSTTAW